MSGRGGKRDARRSDQRIFRNTTNDSLIAVRCKKDWLSVRSNRGLQIFKSLICRDSRSHSDNDDREIVFCTAFIASLFEFSANAFEVIVQNEELSKFVI